MRLYSPSSFIKSSWEPCSTTRPSWKTATSSQNLQEDSLWEMNRAVRPWIRALSWL